MKTSNTKLIPRLNPEQFLRFRNSIDENHKSGCWPWIGSPDAKGYGTMCIGKSGAVKSHRIAFKLHNGYDPVGFMVAHKCDNPPCCNPEHLFKTDQNGNIQDMIRKGRDVPLKGEQNGRSKLSIADVFEIRRLFSNGKHTKASIGRMFGVTDVQIGHIIHAKAWKHI